MCGIAGYVGETPNPSNCLAKMAQAIDHRGPDNKGIWFDEKSDKFEILGKFIKDLSSETPNVETYLYVRDYISSYQLGIDITSKALKDKVIEINTTLKFEDKGPSEKKSHYEIVYATVIKVDETVKEKKDLEKIILCDVPTKIYPDLENAFLNLIHNSGHPTIKLEKKIDFNKLYRDRSN